MQFSATMSFIAEKATETAHTYTLSRYGNIRSDGDIGDKQQPAISRILHWYMSTHRSTSTFTLVHAAQYCDRMGQGLTTEFTRYEKCLVSSVGKPCPMNATADRQTDGQNITTAQTALA